MANKRVGVTLRLKPEVREKLEDIVRINSRVLRVNLSINNQLERLIEDEFDRLVKTGNQ